MLYLPSKPPPAVAGGDAIKKGRIRIALSHASPPFYLTIVPFPTVANLGRTEKICQENFAVFPCADPAVNFTRFKKIACIQDDRFDPSRKTACRR
jgi:hypothetical protein